MLICKKSIGAALFAASMLSLGGCAGSGVDAPGGGPGANPFQGQFSASGALDSGKTGNMQLTVAADGKVSGTLKVVAGPAFQRALAPFVFPVGSFSVSGTATNAGAIALTGTAGQAGAFTVSGFLPNNNLNTNYTIKAGSSIFTGSVSHYTDPGQTSVEFSHATGTNAHLGEWVSPSVSFTDDATDEFKVQTSSNGAILRKLDVNVKDNMAVGSTAPAANKVIWNEYPGGLLPVAWASNSGQIKLLARNGSKVRIQIIDVVMEPAPGLGGEGTFTINAVIDVP